MKTKKAKLKRLYNTRFRLNDRGAQVTLDAEKAIGKFIEDHPDVSPRDMQLILHAAVQFGTALHLTKNH